MRILHVTDAWGTTGGITSYLGHLTRALEERGHVTGVWSPPPGWKTHLSRWNGLGIRRRFRRLLGEFRPDVVHGHSLALAASPWPLRAAREAGVPTVVTVHDYAWICPRKWMVRADGSLCRDGFGWCCLVRACGGVPGGAWSVPYHQARWLKAALHRRVLARHVDRFICPSALLGRWTAASIGAGRTGVIPNFVAGPAEPPPPARGANVLFVGRLSREKGADLVIEALPRLLAARTDASLTLAGDGPVRRELEAAAGLRFPAGKVTFAGDVHGAALEELWAAASVVAVPSRWLEILPTVVLEAMARGRAVVAADVGGLPEMVDHGKTGFLVKRDDPEALAAALITILGDPGLARRMGAAARARFDREFTAGPHLDTLLTVYRELRQVGERDRRPTRPTAVPVKR